jgi:hypothetical protein
MKRSKQKDEDQSQNQFVKAYSQKCSAQSYLAVIEDPAKWAKQEEEQLQNQDLSLGYSMVGSLGYEPLSGPPSP